MGMPEPRDPTGFWAKVKDLAIDQLWPPDPEELVYALADRWGESANLVDGVAADVQAGAARVPAAWPDEAGMRFLQALVPLAGHYRDIAAQVRVFSDGIRQYGDQIVEAKISIIIEVAVNAPLYFALSRIPGGGRLANHLAHLVASRLTTMITGIAARGIAGLARVSLETIKEMADEAFINSMTQLSAMMIGVRERFDGGQFVHATAAGGVGGVLGEGITAVNKAARAAATKLARAVKGDSDYTLPSLPNNLATRIVSGGARNAATSPSANVIVENYDDPEALLDASRYGDAIAEGGLSSAVMSTPRTVAVEMAIQKNLERLGLVGFEREFQVDAGPKGGGGGGDPSTASPGDAGLEGDGSGAADVKAPGGPEGPVETTTGGTTGGTAGGATGGSTNGTTSGTTSGTTGGTTTGGTAGTTTGGPTNGTTSGTTGGPTNGTIGGPTGGTTGETTVGTTGEATGDATSGGQAQPSGTESTSDAASATPDQPADTAPPSSPGETSWDTGSATPDPDVPNQPDAGQPETTRPGTEQPASGSTGSDSSSTASGPDHTGTSVSEAPADRSGAHIGSPIVTSVAGTAPATHAGTAPPASGTAPTHTVANPVVGPTTARAERTEAQQRVPDTPPTEAPTDTAPETGTDEATPGHVEVGGALAASAASIAPSDPDPAPRQPGPPPQHTRIEKIVIPAPQSPLDVTYAGTAKKVPGFEAKANRMAKGRLTERMIAELIFEVARAAGIESIEKHRAGGYKGIRKGLGEFRFRVRVGHTDDGNPAQFSVVDGVGVIVVSPTLITSTPFWMRATALKRALAHEIGELNQVLLGNDDPEEAHSHGRQAEMRILNEEHLAATAPGAANVARRMAIRRHMRLLAEDMRVHPTQDSSQQNKVRLQQDVELIVDQHFPIGSRASFHAFLQQQDDGLPSHKWFMSTAFVTGSMPGIGVAVVIGTAGANPVLGGAIALSSIVTGLGNGLIGRWYAKLALDAADALKAKQAEKAAHEAALRVKALLDPLLSVPRGTQFADPADAPAEPAPIEESLTGVPERWQRLVRWLPSLLGSAAATAMFPVGPFPGPVDPTAPPGTPPPVIELSTRTLLGMWAASLALLGGGPIVEKWLRNRQIAAELAQLEAQGETLSQQETEFIEGVVADLYMVLAWIDTIDGTKSQPPVPSAPPPRLPDDHGGGPNALHFGVSLSPSGAAPTLRALVDLIGRLNGLEAALAGAAGVSRSVISTLVGAFVDRRFHENELRIADARVRHELTVDQAFHQQQRLELIKQVLERTLSEVQLAARQRALGGDPAEQPRPTSAAERRRLARENDARSAAERARIEARYAELVAEQARADAARLHADRAGIDDPRHPLVQAAEAATARADAATAAAKQATRHADAAARRAGLPERTTTGKKKNKRQAKKVSAVKRRLRRDAADAHAAAEKARTVADYTALLAERARIAAAEARLAADKAARKAKETARPRRDNLFSRDARRHRNVTQNAARAAEERAVRTGRAAAEATKRASEAAKDAARALEAAREAAERAGLSAVEADANTPIGAPLISKAPPDAPEPRATPLAPPDDSAPSNVQDQLSYLWHGTLRNGVSWVAVAGAAVVINSMSETPVLPGFLVAALGVASTIAVGGWVQRWRDRVATAEAEDKLIAADRESAQETSKAAQGPRLDYLMNPILREIAVQRDGTVPDPDPTFEPTAPPSMTPTHIDATHPWFTEYVRTMVGLERAHLDREPRPYLLFDRRLRGLTRLDEELRGIDELRRQADATRDRRQLDRAVRDLEDTWFFYQRLMTTAKDMPAPGLAPGKLAEERAKYPLDLGRRPKVPGALLPSMADALAASQATPGGRTFQPTAQPAEEHEDHYTVDLGDRSFTMAELATILRYDPGWQRQPVWVATGGVPLTDDQLAELGQELGVKVKGDPAPPPNPRPRAEPQPDEDPMPPLRPEGHSLGVFHESRLTRDARGRITHIDDVPVRQKLRELADLRARQYSSLDAPNHQRPDQDIRHPHAIELAIDLGTGEVFEATDGSRKTVADLALHANPNTWVGDLRSDVRSLHGRNGPYTGASARMPGSEAKPNRMPRGRQTARMIEKLLGDPDVSRQLAEAAGLAAIEPDDAGGYKGVRADGSEFPFVVSVGATHDGNPAELSVADGRGTIVVAPTLLSSTPLWMRSIILKRALGHEISEINQVLLGNDDPDVAHSYGRRTELRILDAEHRNATGPLRAPRRAALRRHMRLLRADIAPGTFVGRWLGRREQDRLRSYLDNSTAVPGGRRFFTAGDPLRTDPVGVPPEVGTYTLDLHGVEYGADGTAVRVGSHRLTVEHLAAILELDPNWHGQPIRLLACRSGSHGEDSFAQRLADRLQVRVLAPTRHYGVADDGTQFVTDVEVDANGIAKPRFPPTGEMRWFDPRTDDAARLAPGRVELPVRIGGTGLDDPNPWRLRGGDGYQPSDAERHLAGRTVLDRRAIGGKHGSTALLALLDDGSMSVEKPVHSEVIKVRTAGEANRVRLPVAGRLAQRELATSRMDELFGFGLVPTTTMIVDDRHGPSTLQRFAERRNAGGIIENFPWHRQQRFAVLDYVTGQLDRHPGNYLTSPAGDPVAYDNALSFPYATSRPIRSSFVASQLGQPLDPEVLAAVRAVTPDAMRAMLLATGVGDLAVDLAIARLREVQRYGRILGLAWAGQITDAYDNVVPKVSPDDRVPSRRPRKRFRLFGGDRHGAGPAPERPRPAPGAPWFEFSGLPTGPEPAPSWLTRPDRTIPVVQLVLDIFDRSMPYPDGRALYAPGSRMLDGITLVPSMAGYLTLDMHGGTRSVRFGNLELNAEHVAMIVQRDPNWRPGRPIRLLASQTGRDDDGFAQQLADLLQVKVLAPTGYVAVANDGTISGTMRAFHPRVRQASPGIVMPRDFPALVEPSDLDRHNPSGLRDGGREER